MGGKSKKPAITWTCQKCMVQHIVVERAPASALPCRCEQVGCGRAYFDVCHTGISGGSPHHNGGRSLSKSPLPCLLLDNAPEYIREAYKRRGEGV